ncbi:hypothetical protein ACHWQZ_G012840 [Mnemiopsis leidyi]
MAATRRLNKELQDIKKQGLEFIADIAAKEDNILQWKLIIRPLMPPFNNGAFKIELSFPTEYPFKPPILTFQTPIYHPNVDEKGQVCLPIINAANWKPATKTEQVLQALVALIHEPEPEHPLRSELAKEYLEERSKFMKNATEHTTKHASG